MNTENIFLVKRAQRRDKDAFCELMDLQMKDMYRVAIAILASEECDAGYHIIVLGKDRYLEEAAIL